MDTQNNNLPFKANEVISILQTAPDILARNEASVSACTNAGKTLLDTIEGNGGIGTDEIDTAVQEYLAKSKKTVENMNNRRKPLTQMLTAISKRFTTLEGSIDAKSKGTIPYLLQMERNKYAAKKLEEQKRREEEARQKQLAENEKAQYRADITVLLDTTYAAYVEKHINALNGIFNRASLATYGDVCRQITQTSTGFSWTDFVKNVVDNKQTFYMDGETRKAIRERDSHPKEKRIFRSIRFRDRGTETILGRPPPIPPETTGGARGNSQDQRNRGGTAGRGAQTERGGRTSKGRTGT